MSVGAGNVWVPTSGGLTTAEVEALVAAKSITKAAAEALIAEKAAESIGRLGGAGEADEPNGRRRQPTTLAAQTGSRHHRN